MGLRYNLPRLYIAGILLCLLSPVATGARKAVPDSILDGYRLVNDYVDDNEECFRCHGESRRYGNAEIGHLRQIRALSAE